MYRHTYIHTYIHLSLSLSLSLYLLRQSFRPAPPSGYTARKPACCAKGPKPYFSWYLAKCKEYVRNRNLGILFENKKLGITFPRCRKRRTAKQVFKTKTNTPRRRDLSG